MSVGSVRAGSIDVSVSFLGRIAVALLVIVFCLVLRSRVHAADSGSDGLSDLGVVRSEFAPRLSGKG